MRYSFHPNAQRELLEAISYYRSCKPGLEIEFVEEIYSSIQRILRFPKAWSSLSIHTRRCLIKRFPFGIIYSEQEGEIVIIAIMQLNRKPGYWKKRAKKPSKKSSL
jgi:plasmid stabilization system protein ParE